MKKLLSILLLLITCSVFAFPKIPDATMSPGEKCIVKDPDFTEFRYAERIPYCKRRVSKSRKMKVYAAYGIDYSNRSNYTIDHIIPLSIGGSNNVENLWPEHLFLKCKRGNLEFSLYLDVRNGVMKQVDAVATILASKFKGNKEEYLFNLTIPYAPEYLVVD